MDIDKELQPQKCFGSCKRCFITIQIKMHQQIQILIEIEAQYESVLGLKKVSATSQQCFIAL